MSEKWSAIYVDGKLWDLWEHKKDAESIVNSFIDLDADS
jgi:hypothetical protein